MRLEKLKISGMAVRTVVVPMRRPLQTSTGAVSVAPLLLVDLKTNDGIVGRSYLFAIGKHNLKPIAALLEAMAEMLKGDAVAPFEIEKPIRADDFAGCRKVADEVATPIQIGENFMGPEQMAQAIAMGCCDYVMPDAQRIGGVTGWMRAAALAQGAGLEMSSHLFPEASAQLLAVTPTCHWLEYVDWANPVLEEPVAVRDGKVIAPARPGLGMTWNEKAVKKFAA